MIPLDLEKVFGFAVWEALRRPLTLASCLVLGSFFAILSAVGAFSIIRLTPLAGGSFLPSFHYLGFISVPVDLLTSGFAFLAVPNAFFASFYFLRVEEPTSKRFITFAAIQQISLTGAFNTIAFQPNFALESLLSSLILWFFSLGFLALLPFARIFYENKKRCNHESHLMEVAHENALWREEVKKAEFIPPPPSGPAPPKPRPLRK